MVRFAKLGQNTGGKIQRQLVENLPGRMVRRFDNILFYNLLPKKLDMLQVPLADEILSMMLMLPSQSDSPCVIHASKDSKLLEEKMMLTMAYKEPSMVATKHKLQRCHPHEVLVDFSLK